MSIEDQLENPGKRFGDYMSTRVLFSEQHLKDIDTFKKLLTSMKSDIKDDGSGGTVLRSFSDSVDSFLKLCMKVSLALTADETNRVRIISNSDYPIDVKKSMGEDLIGKIKERHKSEVLSQKENRRISGEIYDLENPGLKIICWYRLFRYSLTFGTLTLFRHRFKSSSLVILKRDARIWVDSIIKSIKKELDENYYYYTNLQYNVLELFLRLEDSLRDIINISFKYNYSTSELETKMNRFASIYLVIYKNREVLDSAIDTVLKLRKLGPGFKEVIMRFVSIRIVNQKEKKISRYELINNYIEGVLLSFYSSSRGMVIKSLDQIIYILNVNTKIKDHSKNLTKKAEQRECENHKLKRNEKRISQNKYNELKRVMERYLPAGEKLKNKLLSYELKSAYKNWVEDGKTKPLMPLKGVVEIFIKYVLDLYKMDDAFTLEYDGTEFNNFLNIKPEISQALKKYNLVDFDLFGTSAKIFSNYRLPDNLPLDSFFSTLFRHDYDKTLVSSDIKYIRPVLQKISSLSYELAMGFNEMISGYYNDREIVSDDITKNYDFFESALLKSSSFNKLPLILGKDSISLKDSLEFTCSIAFYICKLLNHPGLETIAADKAEFEKKAVKKKDNKKQDKKQLKEESTATAEIVKKSLADVSIDSLTGLRKSSFLEDHIFTEFYGEDRKYFLDTKRFVVFCSINNLSSIISQSNYSTGDSVIKEVSRILKVNIYGVDGVKGNEIIRITNSEILIFLNGLRRADVIDKALKINRDIAALSFQSGDKIISGVSFSVGIYEERTGTIFDDNMEVVKYIMNFGRRRGKNETAFVKNSDLVIEKKHLVLDDKRTAEIITSVH